MAVLPVGKRRFHAFLSHAHADRARAEQLYEWLRDVAGVPVWYDAVDLPGGGMHAIELPEAIENSRALILLLSEASVARPWVRQEFQNALNHQAEHTAFRIIPIRLDGVAPPGFLQNYSYISLGENGLDAESAANLLKGLYQQPVVIDPGSARTVYVSRGWHTADAPLADGICRLLTESGLQLVGDAEDQASWVESRVAGIMDECGAFAAVLPFRPHSPHGTSKYVLREWELARRRGLPVMVVADNRIELTDELASTPELLRASSEETAPTGLAERAVELAEEWRPPASSPYIFYATDFAQEDRSLRRAVQQLVEAVTALPCLLGEYVRGHPVQREILGTVTGAALVLADISRDGPNVYIEIGAARAADVPIALLRHGPPGRPAFMLRDQQVWDYGGDAELLGRLVRIVYPHRRSLLAGRGS